MFASTRTMQHDSVRPEARGGPSLLAPLGLSTNLDSPSSIVRPPSVTERAPQADAPTSSLFEKMKGMTINTLLTSNGPFLYHSVRHHVCACLPLTCTFHALSHPVLFCFPAPPPSRTQTPGRPPMTSSPRSGSRSRTPTRASTWPPSKSSACACKSSRPRCSATRKTLCCASLSSLARYVPSPHAPAVSLLSFLQTGISTCRRHSQQYRFHIPLYFTLYLPPALFFRVDSAPHVQGAQPEARPRHERTFPRHRVHPLRRLPPHGAQRHAARAAARVPAAALVDPVPG